MTTRSIWQRSRRDVAAKQVECGRRSSSEILSKIGRQRSERMPKNSMEAMSASNVNRSSFGCLTGVSFAWLGEMVDACKFPGARVFARPALIVRAGHRAASRRVGSSLLEASSLAGQSEFVV